MESKPKGKFAHWLHERKGHANVIWAIVTETADDVQDVRCIDCGAHFQWMWRA